MGDLGKQRAVIGIVDTLISFGDTADTALARVGVVDALFRCAYLGDSATGIGDLDAFAARFGDGGDSSLFVVCIEGLLLRRVGVSGTFIDAVVGEAMLGRCGHASCNKIAVGIIGETLRRTVGVGDLCEAVFGVIGIGRASSQRIGNALEIASLVIAIVSLSPDP